MRDWADPLGRHGRGRTPRDSRQHRAGHPPRRDKALEIGVGVVDMAHDRAGQGRRAAPVRHRLPDRRAAG
ncbi:MAG: hypothetical protein HND48_21870 [Chloroflexi bacterium]|nr:hypothetical protein [Chloroflexota bacterium]